MVLVPAWESGLLMRFHRGLPYLVNMDWPGLAPSFIRIAKAIKQARIQMLILESIPWVPVRRLMLEFITLLQRESKLSVKRLLS